ncbi:CRISPR-associated endoribonuclease Cas6 [Cesiribacter andamanensis]|uniref:CRISPR-associated endoribonuclease n=1 Tax=Cesiribacter andamanensis AMV16 TaxID=1279009 RepID=M7P0M1_9BACT|nr:CRISPR-associated endoribonuclease Cas6 [Cesiribacter andamanensis]EMR04144.1 putative protein predicted to be involved in DNA repair (RAMP superfamily) [Cesiribacter andamanensis AMV16]
MRFQFTLVIKGNRRFLPLNYQYELSSWVYKRMAAADAAYADFLHQKGYGAGSKKFKLFCFSPLMLQPYRIHKDQGVFELLGEEIQLQVGFMAEQAAEAFIKGVFIHQHLGLGNRISQVDMEVAKVATLSEPHFQECMHYSALSPIVISRFEEGRRYAQYLHPSHPQYADALLSNLVNKWVGYQSSKELVGAGGAIEGWEEKALQFRLLTPEPKSKMVTIKALTDQETKVRGYLFDFKLQAPIEIHRLLYAAGVGEKGSMGFGWVEKI